MDRKDLVTFIHSHLPIKLQKEIIHVKYRLVIFVRQMGLVEEFTAIFLDRNLRHNLDANFAQLFLNSLILSSHIKVIFLRRNRILVNLIKLFILDHVLVPLSPFTELSNPWI